MDKSLRNSGMTILMAMYEYVRTYALFDDVALQGSRRNTKISNSPAMILVTS
jgi:hypothetical protein